MEMPTLEVVMKVSQLIATAMLQNLFIVGHVYYSFCLTGQYDMFFNQTQVNFKLTVHETSDTPILSAVLYIDKNIANKTEFELDTVGPYFLSENIILFD